MHDTEKPVELMKILIENSTKPNDIVFEPFAGIGAVPRACLETNRRFIACELDETYTDISVNFISDYIEKHTTYSNNETVETQDIETN